MLATIADRNKANPIVIQRTTIYAIQPGRLLPFYWLYEATGPDGVKFDNRSLVTLRQVLRRHYGRGIEIIEAWEVGSK